MKGAQVVQDVLDGRRFAAISFTGCKFVARCPNQAESWLVNPHQVLSATSDSAMALDSVAQCVLADDLSLSA